MSRHQVIHRVGEALRDVLAEGFSSSLDDSVNLLVGDSPREQISLAPPAAEESAQRSLSLWLFLVNEHEHSKNRPQMVSREGELVPPPLSLSLHYLVTPGAPESQNAEEAQETVQLILGKVLQIFHEQPIIGLVDREAGVAEELHLSLHRLSLDELTRIWAALGRPYLLSVCYRINVARIDSLRLSKGALILEREFEHTELVRLSG